jgi:hypothetical protein
MREAGKRYAGGAKLVRRSGDRFLTAQARSFESLDRQTPKSGSDFTDGAVSSHRYATLLDSRDGALRSQNKSAILDIWKFRRP